MRTVSDYVKDFVLSTPFVEEALAQGWVNYSALARRLRPGIEEELFKEVSEAAIAMALRRLSETLPAEEAGDTSSLCYVREITVRSDLEELTYRASENLLTSFHGALADRPSSGQRFVTFTQGVREATIVVDRESAREILPSLEGEVLIAHLETLAAVTMRLADESLMTPGVHYGILKALALRGINVVEVVSTYTEFTVLLDRQDVDRAFSILLRN